MSVVAVPTSSSNGLSHAAPPVTRAPSPYPTRAALALEQSTMHELELVFQRSTTPDLEALAGWEFRGINRLPLNQVPLAKLAGIKKFVKGFHKTDDGRVLGYNCAVHNNILDGRWYLKPNDQAPKRFGFYEVISVDPTSRDNAYLHAVLLDYSKGDNSVMNPMSLLRDYLVQVDPSNPDLYLGKAYGAVGPTRIPLNFFILERHRRGLTDYARR